LKNPEYNMAADTLRYHTASEKAFFLGPTTIIADENTIYCENGWYDTNQNLSQFNKNAKIFSNSQSISGDSLFYNRERGYGKAIRNVEIWDTVQNLIISGNFAEYFEKKDEAIVSDSAVLIDIYEDDSLFLHADTLRSAFDTTGKHKILLAYNEVRFYKPDLQGKCDSIVFFYQDSTIKLFSDPVIWSEQNQMTADFIHLKWREGGIESLSFENNSFIVSQIDTQMYNQIKGKDMLGSYVDNDLRRIEVTGNGETVYFAQEEDSSYVGVNKAICSDMMIYVEENNIKKITFLKQPSATLYPINELTTQELELKGFVWVPEKRPLSKEDIFIWK
jgi:lipopolysaccharide export system protein LptA